MDVVISIPGKFRDGSAYLDLETKKVPTTNALRGRGLYGGFIMQNGEMLRNRWSIVMYGVALNGYLAMSDNSTEHENITGLGNILTGWDLGAASGGVMAGDITEVVYAATRQFDEMIAKGRFTNARRAHEPTPFFPAVPGANDLPWRSVAPIPKDIQELRGPDLPSKDISQEIATNWSGVAVHLLRDVIQLILIDGDPNNRCDKWCRRVMSDSNFALSLLP